MSKPAISKKEVRALVTFASEAAYGAGAILKEGFRKNKAIRYKGRIDPVTEFDLRSEKFIVSKIKSRYPDHGLLAEEGSEREQTSEFRWVIDPLDGTVNYAHRFPIYCVSIGLEMSGQIVAGVVYDPERDELFSAGQNIGASLNGKKIVVSDEPKLERALLATGFAYNIKKAKRNNLGLFARMSKKAQGIRRPGSAAMDLCWLASGRLDGFWELYLHPWDTAAGLIIVEEAGGKVTQFDGSAYDITSDEILASNDKLHRQLQRVLCHKQKR